eukprot:jgi/Ulvmu1/6325/UM029_0033.1
MVAGSWALAWRARCTAGTAQTVPGCRFVLRLFSGWAELVGARGWSSRRQGPAAPGLSANWGGGVKRRMRVIATACMQPASAVDKGSVCACVRVCVCAHRAQYLTGTAVRVCEPSRDSHERVSGVAVHYALYRMTATALHRSCTVPAPAARRWRRARLALLESCAAIFRGCSEGAQAKACL